MRANFDHDYTFTSTSDCSVLLLFASSTYAASSSLLSKTLKRILLFVFTGSDHLIRLRHT